MTTDRFTDAHQAPDAATTATAYRPPLGAGPRRRSTRRRCCSTATSSARNIARMAAFAAGGPAKLRPHSKTHKCVEIARLQLDAGAVGITCAKVGEAEALADGGIPDILIANQIVGPIKIARLVALARRCTVTVAVDDAGNVAAALGGRARRPASPSAATSRSTSAWRAAACPTGAAALELARLVDGCAGARLRRPADLRGPPAERRAARGAGRPRRARHGARRCAASEAVEAGGLAVGQVSGGGTGTHMVTGRLPWMTELQCGSYATMDAQYRAVGGADFENALTVLATVISRPRPDRAVIDAGLKAVTPEFGDPTVLVEGASWLDFSEEHGEVALSGPARELRVGDKIELDPAPRLHHRQPLRPLPRDARRPPRRHLARWPGAGGAERTPTCEAFVRGLPKAELHLHIEGTLEPELMLALGERNGVPVPYADADEARAAYRFADLRAFLNLYYRGMAVLRTERDFFELTAAYLRRAGSDGARHVEVFFDPQSHLVRGVAFDEVVGGIAAALADGRARARRLLASDHVLPARREPAQRPRGARAGDPSSRPDRRRGSRLGRGRPSAGRVRRGLRRGARRPALPPLPTPARRVRRPTSPRRSTRCAWRASTTACGRSTTRRSSPGWRASA